MKVVLFCGGMGMRMREVSSELPKPLIPVCGLPIVGHLMKYYIYQGFDDFILCLGHLGRTFHDYFELHQVAEESRDAMGNRVLEVQLPGDGPARCRITLADTGQTSSVGMRLKNVQSLLQDEPVFQANYADALADLMLREELSRFLASDKLVAFGTVRPRQTFHIIRTNPDGEVQAIDEMATSGVRVNGGFFFMRREFLTYIHEGEDLLYEPMERLIAEKKVTTYEHNGFWACMDTLKDKLEFDERCARDEMPWQLWRNEQP